MSLSLFLRESRGETNGGDWGASLRASSFSDEYPTGLAIAADMIHICQSSATYQFYWGSVKRFYTEGIVYHALNRPRLGSEVVVSSSVTESWDGKLISPNLGSILEPIVAGCFQPLPPSSTCHHAPQEPRCHCPGPILYGQDRHIVHRCPRMICKREDGLVGRDWGVQRGHVSGFRKLTGQSSRFEKTLTM
jgi:hypothetical protein